MTNQLVIRKASSSEVQVLFQRIVEEGWNPGVYDIQAYTDNRNMHFFCGLINDEIVSAISVCIYDVDYAFAGCYVVLDPSQRGKGYGVELARYLLSYMDENGIAVSGLDGVLAQIQNYEQCGYREAYLHRRFQYQISGVEKLEGMVSIAPPIAEEISIFDSHFVAEPRRSFWQSWLVNDPSKKFASIKNSFGQLTGFACLRKATDGYRVGPLYAASINDAMKLFDALMSQAKTGENVYIDIPEANCHSDHFIKQLSLTPMSFECMRMYRGVAPQTDLNAVYGVCTLEVG
ncbi:MAG: GNAT family N-acetyltransferase [Parashewanella sp.]